MVERNEPSRKRLFIGLLCGTGLAVCALLAVVWIVPYVGLANIHPLAPWVLGALFALGILVVLWATLAWPSASPWGGRFSARTICAASWPGCFCRS